MGNEDFLIETPQNHASEALEVELSGCGYATTLPSKGSYLRFVVHDSSYMMRYKILIVKQKPGSRKPASMELSSLVARWLWNWISLQDEDLSCIPYRRWYAHLIDVSRQHDSQRVLERTFSWSVQRHFVYRSSQRNCSRVNGGYRRNSLLQDNF